MSFGGWIFLICAWGIIIGVAAYCYARTLSCEEPDYGDEK